MDFWVVNFITRPKVVEIHIIDVVIYAVEKMAEDQGFKSLNFIVKKRKDFFSNVDLAGVDKPRWRR